MPTLCYVPFCKSGHKDNPVKRKMFTVPKDEKLRKQWERMIPRKDVLKPSHKVCEIHFEESDIIKGKIFVINGKKDFFPSPWKLKEGALPRIFPGCPGYLNKRVKGRKPPKDRSLVIVQKKIKPDKENDKAAVQENNKDCSSVIKTVENPPPHVITIKNIELIRLPSLAWSWVLIDDPEPLRILMSNDKKIVCSESVRTGEKIYSRRSIEFNLLTGTASYTLYGVPLTSVPTSLETTFSSENDLTNILKNFNSAQLCPGFPLSQLGGIKIPSTLLENGQASRSPTCERILPLNSKQCANCQRMKRSIRRAELRKTAKTNKNETVSTNTEESQQQDFSDEIMEIEVNF